MGYIFGKKAEQSKDKPRETACFEGTEAYSQVEPLKVAVLPLM